MDRISSTALSIRHPLIQIDSNQRKLSHNYPKSSTFRLQTTQVVSQSSLMPRNDPELIPNWSEFIANRRKLPCSSPNRLQFITNRPECFRIASAKPKTRLKLVTIAMKASNSSQNRRKEANDPPTCK